MSLTIAGTLFVVVIPSLGHLVPKRGVRGVAGELATVLWIASRRAASSGKTHAVEIDPPRGTCTLLEENDDLRSYGVFTAVPGRGSLLAIPRKLEIDGLPAPRSGDARQAVRVFFRPDRSNPELRLRLGLGAESAEIVQEAVSGRVHIGGRRERTR